MKSKDIKIGEYYRLKSSPDFGYIKPIEILRPGTWQMKQFANERGIKPFRCIAVKCEHVIDKNITFPSTGFIRYFRAEDIIRCKEEPYDKT